jgi:hypothetical protein
MATALDRDIRRLLDKAVRKARVIVEDGALKALTELGVEDARRPDGLSRDRADLRNRLRAHAQSLGDLKAPNDSIRANRLVREIAYEHWHRALFARFLAENNLLIDPDHKVAVSLSDLEEIAKDEGRDLVELAADWAEPMLPQIFRKDDPVLALALPPETKAGITEIVKGLPRAVFAADDSLGWVYQFWQADQKERVNESEVKIGADELPAVTQLFTEDYMVLFLLENTLGAWWAGKVLAADPALAAGAGSEEELREKTSPPGYRWTYLRFVREPREREMDETATGSWRPAAGTFDDWPKAANDITVLDPCMGSGHFLVFALPILVAFRRAEEGLDEREAVKAVLADNLFGLEIDLRCTQIAAFALALASWKRLGGPEPLPRLNLACSGLAIGLGKAEFLKLTERIADASGWAGEANLLGIERTPLGERAAMRLRAGFERLYELFEEAPHLGSLIDPHRAVAGDFGNLFEEGFDGLEQLLGKTLERSHASYETRETAVTAQGIAKATQLLGRHFTLIATNVPYLGRTKQDDDLKDFIHENFEEAKSDIAVAFLFRLLRLTLPGGSISAVSPQSWLYLGPYKAARVSLLEGSMWHALCALGPRAFEMISGEVVNVSLSILSRRQWPSETRISAIDVAHEDNPQAKQFGLLTNEVMQLKQRDQLRNPDSRISLGEKSDLPLLSRYATSYKGIATGDLNRFIGKFWEHELWSERWAPLQVSVGEHTLYGGRSECIFWEKGNGSLLEFVTEKLGEGKTGAWLRGREAWERRGIAVGQMSGLTTSLYSGDLYDENTAVIVPKNVEHLLAIFAYCRSDEYRAQVRKIDASSLKIPNLTMLKVPFDLQRWQEVSSAEFPSGLALPDTNDPTQWLFSGRSRDAQNPLQVAVARLVGYRWPRQTGSSFMDCPAVTEPDEVERSGLVDPDGIVPLPALTGEADAATRLRELIRAVWGPDYNEGTIRELLAAEEAEATDLGIWLADEFFGGHCRLFHQTPFIWHVWDGVRGGFSALVNYHRLCEGNGAGRRLLEKLRDSYLGEWIAAQRRALAASDAGAEDRLIAAEHLRGELTKIIDGEPPYDIFVRWKPLYRQPIGWEPDTDDGVRLNIRPFLTAKPKTSGRRDGCILRVTPRVKKHAGADRGAEPHREKDDFPWFWANDDDVAEIDFAGGTEPKGRRYNDFHYTRAFKQRARDAAESMASGAVPQPALENQGETS